MGIIEDVWEAVTPGHRAAACHFEFLPPGVDELLLSFLDDDTIRVITKDASGTGGAYALIRLEYRTNYTARYGALNRSDRLRDAYSAHVDAAVDEECAMIVLSAGHKVYSAIKRRMVRAVTRTPADLIRAFCVCAEEEIARYKDRHHTEYTISTLRYSIDWSQVSRYIPLREHFIRDYQNYIDWVVVSKYQTLSENFIRNWQDRVDWILISRYQILSEDFICEWTDCVDWTSISEYQVLSEGFIYKFRNRVAWSLITENQILSQGFINRMISYSHTSTDLRYFRA